LPQSIASNIDAARRHRRLTTHKRRSRRRRRAAASIITPKPQPMPHERPEGTSSAAAMADAITRVRQTGRRSRASIIDSNYLNSNALFSQDDSQTLEDDGAAT